MKRLLVAAAKTGASAAVNIILNVGIIKTLAVMLGPAGVGLYSMLRQSVISFSVVGLGGQTALVQGIASAEGNRRDAYIRTVFWIFVAGTVSTALVIIFLGKWIARESFGISDPHTLSLIPWIAFPVVLANFYLYLKSILNGFRAIGRLALIETAGPLATLFLIYPAAVSTAEGYPLALLWTIATAQLVMLALSLYVALRESWLRPLTRTSASPLDSTSLKHFFRFSGTTLVTATAGGFAILLVRLAVAQTGGLHTAGLFDLAWSLSGIYVMVLLNSFGTYYFPVLSSLGSNDQRLDQIQQVLRVSTIASVPLIIFVVVLKPLLVDVFYSDEFLRALALVQWMLIGDFFRVTSWVLTVPALAKGDLRVYLLGETSWHAGFVASAYVSLHVYGEITGIAIGFTILYVALVMYYAVYGARSYGLRLRSNLVVPWIFGLAIIILASAHTWGDMKVVWSVATFWITIALLYIWLMLSKDEKRVLLSKLLKT